VQALAARGFYRLSVNVPGWPLVSCAGIRGRGRLCGPEGYRPGPYRHTRQSPGLSGKGQHQRSTPGRYGKAGLQ